MREYLLAEHRPLVVRFLDLLGVPHTDGLLGEDPLREPEVGRLDTAIDTVLAEFPRAATPPYLPTLATQ